MDSDPFSVSSCQSSVTRLGGPAAVVNRENLRAADPRLRRPQLHPEPAPFANFRFHPHASAHPPGRLVHERQPGLSVKTADAHRANVMRKLDLHSVSELVLYAVRNQIVQA